MGKENAVQAVVVMDTFNNNFNPVTSYKPMGLFTVAGVPLVNFVLESLALGGVDEAILFCCSDGFKIEEHLRKAKVQKVPWSLTLDVQVLMSDTCQTMGDVMREIDAAGLLRGYFVLTCINSIANIPYASMLKQHINVCKKDKGAAMTLIYKKVSWEHPLIGTDNPTFLAADGNSRKVLIHKKYKPQSKDETITLLLESVLNHSEVKLHHNLLDANIALCSPSVLPLFSDNLDFKIRDDFINGILIHEKKTLASSLYYTLLKDNMYAATVTNWSTFKIISRDILHHCALPLSIESGSLIQDNYESMGNYIFCDKTATLSPTCSLKENVLIRANATIGNKTVIIDSVIGSKCVIGDNVTIIGSHIGNNTVIHDNNTIINSLVGNKCVIGKNCNLDDTIIGANTVIGEKTVIKKSVNGTKCVFNNNVTITGSRNIGNNVVINNNSKVTTSAVGDKSVVGNDSNLEDNTIGNNTVIGQRTVIKKSVIGNKCVIGNNVTITGGNIANNAVVPNNSQIINNFAHDNYTIEKDSDLETGTILTTNVLTSGTQCKGSVVEGGLEWNVFLQELIDTLARGYEDKLKCDYLILEINSSRDAYNIQLNEVNFFVVRALLSLPVLTDAKNVLVVFKDILKFFRPVLANYIKTKSSIMDCLKAVEESCIKCDWLNGKAGRIIQILYGADVVDGDSLLKWYKDLQNNESPIAKQSSLVKFFEWLEDAE